MKVIHNKGDTLYFSLRLWRSVSKYVISSNCIKFLATVWKEFRIWSKRRDKNPYNLALQKICIKNKKGSRYGPFNITNYQKILLLPSLIEITLPNGCSFVDLEYDLMITIFHKQPREPTSDRKYTYITNINIYIYIYMFIFPSENSFMFSFKFCIFHKAFTGINTDNVLHIRKTTLQMLSKVLSEFQINY